MDMEKEILKFTNFYGYRKRDFEIHKLKWYVILIISHITYIDSR